MSIKKRVLAFTACLAFILSTVIIPVAATIPETPFCPSWGNGYFHILDDGYGYHVTPYEHQLYYYAIFECNCGYNWSEEEPAAEAGNHDFVNGFCAVCGYSCINSIIS